MSMGWADSGIIYFCIQYVETLFQEAVMQYAVHAANMR